MLPSWTGDVKAFARNAAGPLEWPAVSLDQRPPLAVLTGALRHAYGFPLRRAVGATMAGAGVTLGLLAGLVAAIGLERALTIWNDQMALLLSLRYRRRTASEASTR